MIPASIKNTVGLIFIMGGTNDAGDSTINGSTIGNTTYVPGSRSDTVWAADSTYYTGGDYDVWSFKGGIASTIMKMQLWCPNAVIVLGTPFSGRGNTSGVNMTAPVYNLQGLTTEDYAKAMIEVAHEFSIPVIDVFATTGINQLNRATYITDSVHPYSTAGKKALARAVIGGLKTIVPNF